jgi:hypothetical protein
MAPREPATAIANKPMGPALAMLRFSPNTSSGTDRMPPPAPVKAIIMPTKTPSPTLIALMLSISPSIHLKVINLYLHLYYIFKYNVILKP